MNLVMDSNLLTFDEQRRSFVARWRFLSELARNYQTMNQPENLQGIRAFVMKNLN